MHKMSLKAPVLKVFLSSHCSWDVLEPLRGGKAYLEAVRSLEVCPQAYVESLAWRLYIFVGSAAHKKNDMETCESSALAYACF